jgi:septum formation protein
MSARQRPASEHSIPLRVILASASPRRRELLTLVGIPHEVRPADIDESVFPGEQPIPHAERLARAKAHALAERNADAVVVAADTIVVLDGEILGKPCDSAHAAAMLRRLSGREHTVFTAIAVARGARTESAVEGVRVWFRALPDEEIEAYIATGEPMDKAGAYGIQGYGATIVERVDGDYFSVMGLGLRRLIELLARVGVGYEFGAGVRTLTAPDA